MLVWGYRQNCRDLGSAGVSMCPTCERERDFRTQVHYQVNHLWYAFGFVSGKRFVEVCSVCRTGRVLDARTVEARVTQAPIPFWDRFGLLALGGGCLALIAFAVLLRLTGPEIRNIPELSARMRQGDIAALEHLRREAEAGDVPSQEALGDLLAGPESAVFRDPEEAFRWTQAAAEQGSVRAAVSLASRFEMGFGTAPDPVQALRWYRRAADQGNAVAANSVGAFHLQGIGTPVDREEALRWFRRAAEAGDIPAAFNLGMAYLAQPNVAEGVRWLDAAASAAQTDPASLNAASSANNELGKLYESGEGVERDTLKALNYYQAAGEANQDAQASVARLKRKLSG